MERERCKTVGNKKPGKKEQKRVCCEQPYYGLAFKHIHASVEGGSHAAYMIFIPSNLRA
jgi:hypothetical protein